MDNLLATAIFARWNAGLPVSETNLYKAASHFGEDPELALVEARYYTTLDNYLHRGGPMTTYEKIALSLANDNDPIELVKTASAYDVSVESIILNSLAKNEYIPYLYKLAQVEPGTPQEGASVAQDPNARQQALDPASIQQLTNNPAALTMQDWQGQTLYKPSPTAPGQIPPGSPEGNIDQLMQQEQNKDQIQAQKDQTVKEQMMAQTQQQPQQGSKEQIQQLYNQMTPEEKAQHAVPEANPQEAPEIAQHIQTVEQQVGTAITDPAQIKKIYGEMQKAKKKEIDEAIKMQFQNQADASSAGQFGPVPDRLNGGQPQTGAQPFSGGQPPPPSGGQPPAGGGEGGQMPPAQAPMGGEKPKGKTTLTKQASVTQQAFLRFLAGR